MCSDGSAGGSTVGECPLRGLFHDIELLPPARHSHGAAMEV